MSFRHSAHGLDTPRGEDWRAFSACVGEDPELFYPVGEAGRRGTEAQAQEDRAKAICGRCPVVDQCLAFALVHQPYGIAGGKNEAERRKLRRAHSNTGRVYSSEARGLRETCKAGLHKLTGDNLLISNLKRGRVRRACKPCRQAYEAKREQMQPRRTRKSKPLLGVAA